MSAVSIVIPVRNAEATLAEAIESCLTQTMTEFHLVLVLNGCTDGSEEIAREFGKKDARIVLATSSIDGGVTEAMGVGVAETSSALVARLDADDRSHPNRLEKQRRLLEKNQHWAAVSCGARLLSPQGEGMQRYVDWVNGLTTPEAVARERFVECPVIQPSMMFRREALKRAGGYRQVSWAEDHDLFLRMLEQGMEIGKVDEILLDWRDSPTRLTRTHEAYAEDQVWAMKAHYLARVERIRKHGVAICGAGPIGKRLAKLLVAEGATMKGFFEVNPRRIGERIGGVEVAGPADFGTKWREAVLLSAVGVAGGRDRVRALAREQGYQEGNDLWCCC